MLNLLINVDPYGDESFQGYLHRLAEANGLSGQTVIDLYKSLESAPLTQLFTIGPKHWPEFSSILRAPPTRPMPVWNVRRRRYCSACLAEAPYWRALWNLTLATACPRHKVGLVDACTNCGAAFDWKSHITTNCFFCGAALSDFPAPSLRADIGEIWLSRELDLRLRNKSQHGISIFKQLSLSDLHEICFRLGAIVSRGNVRRPLKITDSCTLENTRPICHAAAAIFRYWPAGFSRSLDQIRRERGTHHAWRLGAELGPIYQEVFDRMSAKRFDFIRRELERYLLNHWQAPLAKRHRRLSATVILDHRWLPIEEAARRTSLNPALVTRVVNAQEVSSKSAEYTSGRRARVVDLISLQKIAEELRMVLTAEMASEKLGLSTNRIKQLIDAEILNVWGGIPSAGENWMIGNKCVSDLLRCGAAVEIVERQSAVHVPFAHLLRYVMKTGTSLALVMNGIMGGQIQIVGTSELRRRVSDWILDKEQVQAALKAPVLKFKSELSVVDAAQILKVKQEVAYALVNNGDLKSRAGKLSGRAARIIEPGDLATFHHRFVFGVELAEITGKSPKALAKFLIGRNLSPSGGPGVEGKDCRQYYWKRSKRLQGMVALIGAPGRTRLSAEQNTSQRASCPRQK